MLDADARKALESMMRATEDDATPIIRRLARIQARHVLNASAGGDAGPVAALIQWARDQMALPDGSGWLGGHIDENHRYKLRDLVGAIDAARQDAAALALPAPVVEGATCNAPLQVVPAVEHADWMHVARESVAAALPGSAFADRVMAGRHDDSLEVRAAMRAIDATLAALSEGRSHG